MGVKSSASPKFLKGPIAASFASAVISEPENPAHNVSIYERYKIYSNL